MCKNIEKSIIRGNYAHKKIENEIKKWKKEGLYIKSSKKAIKSLKKAWKCYIIKYSDNININNKNI